MENRSRKVEKSEKKVKKKMKKVKKREKGSQKLIKTTFVLNVITSQVISSTLNSELDARNFEMLRVNLHKQDPKMLLSVLVLVLFCTVYSYRLPKTMVLYDDDISSDCMSDQLCQIMASMSLNGDFNWNRYDKFNHIDFGQHHDHISHVVRPLAGDW